MGTAIVYSWVPGLQAGGQWRQGSIDPVQEESYTVVTIFAPLPPWFTYGGPTEVYLRIRPYLSGVISQSRAMNQDMTQSIADYVTRCQELARTVFEAMLVIANVQIPGVPRCLLCESPLADRNRPGRTYPVGESMMTNVGTILCSRFTVLPWSLNSYEFRPSWPSSCRLRLCVSHMADFFLAMRSIALGMASLPPWHPVDRPSHESSRQGSSNPEAPVGPSS